MPMLSDALAGPESPTDALGRAEQRCADRDYAVLRCAIRRSLAQRSGPLAGALGGWIEAAPLARLERMLGALGCGRRLNELCGDLGIPLSRRRLPLHLQ